VENPTDPKLEVRLIVYYPTGASIMVTSRGAALFSIEDLLFRSLF